MKKGFTMIELIFVIVILGILASVAIPRLASTREDAEVSSAVANLRTLVGDASGYYVVNGKFGDGDAGAKWSEFTNVPLNNSNGVASTSAGIIKIAGQNCIHVQVKDRSVNAPAHILVSKDSTNKNSGTCKEVIAAAPIKAYFESRVEGVEGLNDDKGAIPIGSRARVYDTVASAAGVAGSAAGSSSAGSAASRPGSSTSTSRPQAAVSTAQGPGTVTINVPGSRPTTTTSQSSQSTATIGGAVTNGTGSGTSSNAGLANAVINAQQQGRPVVATGGSVAAIGGRK